MKSGGFVERLDRRDPWGASLTFLDDMGRAVAWKVLDCGGNWTIECNDAARTDFKVLGVPFEAEGDESRTIAWLEKQPDHFFDLTTGELWIWRPENLEPCPKIPLTPREEEVAALTLSGKTAEEIGLILSLSPRTVEKHVQHIYAKSGAHSRLEFFQTAFANDDGAAQPEE